MTGVWFNSAVQTHLLIGKYWLALFNKLIFLVGMSGLGAVQRREKVSESLWHSPMILAFHKVSSSYHSDISFFASFSLL
jgi:hypothetical protein